MTTVGENRNERGVALLIALLVMTLLMALVMEFAYGTRVSMRAAANFRDSRRAEHLARSGVNVAGKILGALLDPTINKPQDSLQQREWQVLPVMSGDETELRIRWEDEAGKINIRNVSRDTPAYNRLVQLFDLKGVNDDILDPMMTDKKNFAFIQELHQIMSDEDFEKVQPYLTVHSAVGDGVSINSASLDVLKCLLRSLGRNDGYAEMIVARRNQNAFLTPADLTSIFGEDSSIKSHFTGGNNIIVSNVFTVHSHATVGGYTKQAEAVIRRSPGGFTILSMKVL